NIEVLPQADAPVSVSQNQDTGEAEQQSGFVVDEGWVYYYLNGVPVIGTDMTINGITYRFDSEGHLAIGLQRDVQDENGNLASYYYIDTAPYVYFGMMEDGNSTYYFGNDGRMAYGEHYVGGYWYYFDQSTG